MVGDSKEVKARLANLAFVVTTRQASHGSGLSSLHTLLARLGGHILRR